jgi:hypothetical protein
MRAFTTDDVAQSNPGSNTAAPSISVTVPNGVVEGRAGIIMLAATVPLAPPAQWDMSAQIGAGGGLPTLAIMCRAGLPGGESSWPFTSSAGSPNWCWLAEEWTNISSVPLQSTAPGSFGTTGDTSIATGSTGTFDAQFVVGLAVVQIQSAGGSAWPTVAWSNSFVETDVVSVGTGTAAGDLQLRVARRYGTDSEAGPWETTATFTGSMTFKTPNAVLAVFRAEDTMDAPASTIIAS